MDTPLLSYSSPVRSFLPVPSFKNSYVLKQEQHFLSRLGGSVREDLQLTHGWFTCFNAFQHFLTRRSANTYPREIVRRVGAIAVKPGDSPWICRLFFCAGHDNHLGEATSRRRWNNSLLSSPQGGTHGLQAEVISSLQRSEHVETARFIPRKLASLSKNSYRHTIPCRVLQGLTHLRVTGVVEG